MPESSSDLTEIPSDADASSQMDVDQSGEDISEVELKVKKSKKDKHEMRKNVEKYRKAPFESGAIGDNEATPKARVASNGRSVHLV